MQYVFDQLAVVTTTVTLDGGEEEARRAANALEDIRVMAVPGGDLSLDKDVAPGIVFDVRTVAPRGMAYLVEVEGDTDPGVNIEYIPEPIDGCHRDQLLDELTSAMIALQGDSNDAEHDALYALAQVVADAVGAPFDIQDTADDMEC